MKRLAAGVFAFVAIACLVTGSRPAKAVATGNLIKGSGSTVYYYAQDGKRHVFPTEKIFKSWYADFTGVTKVTDAELAAIPLGANVTYHPGVRLVKIQTDPKVYAVDKHGSLRWIMSEAIAATLYGADWNKQVDDIPDAFFVNYRVDASIGSAFDFDRDGARATASINDDLVTSDTELTSSKNSGGGGGGGGGGAGSSSHSCTADTWSCTAWNACSTSGSQTRLCSMTKDCAGVTTPSPATTQSCTYTSPTTCTADTWSCTDWAACSTGGSQTRACTMSFDCPSATTASPATSQSCTPPTTPPTSTTTTTDLITDNGFESSVGGFVPLYPADGSVEQTTTNPIAGTKSLKVNVNAYGRVAFMHDYPWDGGPLAESVTAKAKVRVDSASTATKRLQVCSLVYLQAGGDPLSACATYPVATTVVDVELKTLAGDQRVYRAFFQFKLDDGGTISATVDDAHLFVTVKASGSTPPPACSADTWSCTAWNACSTSGSQTRACTMTVDCPTATTPSPATAQSCTPASSCTADTWSCTDWNECSTSGSQARSCSMTSDCPSVTTPSPATTQSCTYVPPTACTADTWTCGAWSACSTGGSQTRSCSMTTDCAGVTTPSPATSQSCTPSSPPTAGYTALLTDSGSTSPLPVLSDAQDPAEPNMTPTFHVSVPNSQCNRMLGFVNPAVSIPTTSRIREVEATWNGTPLPLINPQGKEVAEEAHSYGSMIGFFKPLFSLASVPAGAGTLEVKAFDGNHAQVTSAVINNLTVASPPAQRSATQMAAVAHPRIYLTPSRLAQIKAKPSTDLTVQRFWSDTEGVGYFLQRYTLATDPESASFENSVYDPESYIPALALCYQLKKDTDATTANKCADAVHKMVMAMAQEYDNGTRDFGRDDGYDIRFALRNMMLAYDWMYEKFTPAERSLLARVNTAFVDWYPTGGYAATLPVENYYAGYLQALTLVPVATAGDNADADRLLGVLRDKLRTEVPVLNQRGCGGDYAEGWNYGPYSMIEFSLVNLTMRDMGEDWGADFDFLNPLARSFTYQVTPDFMMTVPFGDYSGNYGHMTRPATIAVLSGTTSDGALAARLYTTMFGTTDSDIHTFIGGNQTNSRGDTFYELIFGNLSQTANVASMPLSYLNPGTGRWFSKSSLSDASGYQAMSSTISYDGDHYGYDNGDVALYHGSTCILCSSAYRGYPFYGLGETPMFSTFLVNGQGASVNRNAQVLFSTDGGTWSAVGTRFESSYVASRYDENTMSSSMPLDYLIREVVHVRPGILVVRDLHRRRHTTDTLKALWHLGSSSALQTLVAGQQYQLGTTKVSTFSNATAAFTNDNGPGGARLGTLMTQTFPAGVDRMESVTVVSDVASGVSYTGGVLKLSTNQCVTFANGGVNVATCP